MLFIQLQGVLGKMFCELCRALQDVSLHGGVWVQGRVWLYCIRSLVVQGGWAKFEGAKGTPEAMSWSVIR